MSRASATDRPRSSRRRSKNSPVDPISPSPPPPAPSPPLEPPPLTSAYQSLAPPPLPSGQPAIPEPPDTPPPLAPAYPTLPPPSAPVYPQHPPGRSSRLSPPSAAYPSLPAASYQYEDHAYSSSQDARPSSSFARSGDDPRWAYPAHQPSYPTSESDRYSPASPVANAPYPEPASPVDAYHASTHRGYHLSQQQHDNVSYFPTHYQPSRQSSGTALAGSPAPLLHSHSQPQSSHRHSIAHISNPMRQHSPGTASTHSASPVVSHPPTPGYAYGSGAPSSVGSYAESPPSSVSPVAPTPQLPSGLVAGYASYESSSLASAGYSHPPPPPAQATYDRTLPSLSPAHAREAQPHSTLHTHFNYAPTPTYHSAPSAPARRTSPPPVLAPIQDSRSVRRDAGAAGSMRYASASTPQAPAQPPPMQSLASVSRSSGHAFAYPPPSHSYAQTSGSSSYTSAGSAASASAAPAQAHGNAAVHANTGSSAAYYYQHQQHAVAAHGHGHREPSPEPVDDQQQQQYLELHQPQPQRVVASHASHQYIQSGAVLGGGGQAHSHSHASHGAWRTTGDEYRGRGGLVQ
ncbi:hypothetical protein OH77DRAFT_333802 [Trametes cingulata]|nr:hypothetical protein OH77DRAFT_333802 [Trametes cingulata]